MDKEKLKALQDKYREAEAFEVDKQEHQDGMIDPGTMSSGIRTLVDAPYQESMEGLDIALLGVPWDLGVSHRPGARFGPKGIRDMSMLVGPYNHQTHVNPFHLCKVADIGDVPIRMYSHDEGVKDIENYYHKIKDAGVLPVSAGGDHSITYPIMKALGRDEPVGMIHFDAHCDTMGSMDDFKFHHGGPFRHAVLDGVLDPTRCIQIGIRGAAEVFWEFSLESGMTVIHIDEFVEMGVDAVIARAKEVVGDGPTYITFDVDGLDPVYAPGTGTPELGGLSTREAQAILRGLRGLNIIGGDLVEVSPEYDSTTNTVQVGKQLLFEILCLTAESHAAKNT